MLSRPNYMGSYSCPDDGGTWSPEMTSVKRLLTLERLIAYNLPADMLERSRELFENGVRALGDDAPAFIRALPTTLLKFSGHQALVRQWEERCLGCTHRCNRPSYPEESAKDLNWCEMFRGSDRPELMECMHFEPAVVS